MDPEPSLLEDLRRFAGRDWERLAAMKQQAWLARKHELGAASSLREAASLYAWARTVRPDWPSAEDRRLDLESHQRLNRLLDRIPGPR